MEGSSKKRGSTMTAPPMPYKQPVTLNYQLKPVLPSTTSSPPPEKIVPMPVPSDSIEKRAFERRMSMNVASTNKHFFTAPWVNVLVNRELRVGGGAGTEVGSTRHIELDLTGTGVTYQTADNIAVLPENDPVAVALLAAALGCPLDQVYSSLTITPSFKVFKHITSIHTHTLPTTPPHFLPHSPHLPRQHPSHHTLPHSPPCHTPPPGLFSRASGHPPHPGGSHLRRLHPWHRWPTRETRLPFPLHGQRYTTHMYHTSTHSLFTR